MSRKYWQENGAVLKGLAGPQATGARNRSHALEAWCPEHTRANWAWRLVVACNAERVALRGAAVAAVAGAAVTNRASAVRSTTSHLDRCTAADYASQCSVDKRLFEAISGA
jgi:hypothetical protein